MDWKAILGTVAPGIATALGGPLAGLAVQAIGDALGIDGATQEKVSQALSGATPDDLLKLKAAEQAFAVKMRELDIDLDRIAAGDRDSARKMGAETKAHTPAVLSWLVVGSTLLLEGYVLLNGVPEAVHDLVAGRVLGTLDMAFGTVLAYWLGTSASSKSKDEIISRAVK